MNNIFLLKFEKLLEATGLHGRILGQSIPEWRSFLEFAAIYFRHHGIECPIVVEIGTYHDAQKMFYEQFLNAEHIGIDADPRATCDIRGDSHSPATVAKLISRLSGRSIDLLFIDGNHSYRGVKRDYEIYGPLTQHLIAFHDCLCDGHPDIDVGRFWRELVATEKTHSFVLFHKPRKHEIGTPWDGQDMGIGVMVKV